MQKLKDCLKRISSMKKLSTIKKKGYERTIEGYDKNHVRANT